MLIKFYNEYGEEIGTLESNEVPSKGEDLRITEGVSKGDYVVEYIRRVYPEEEVQIRCRTKEGRPDLWPDAREFLGDEKVDELLNRKPEDKN